MVITRNCTEVLMDEIVALTKDGTLDYYVGMDLFHILAERLAQEQGE